MTNPKPGTGWVERPLGGSEEAEERIIKGLGDQIRKIQEENRKQAGTVHLERGQHAKTHAGIVNAQFIIEADLPEDLRGGFFVSGKTYQATVRFSNADGLRQADSELDLRGVAIRVFFDDRPFHDFLLTNAPHNHVENAVEFMIVAEALARKGILANKLGVLGRFVEDVNQIVRQLEEKTGEGFLAARFDAARILATLGSQAQRSAGIKSLVTQDYWSRAPFQFGDLAVQFKVEHTVDGELHPAPEGPDYLREDLKRRFVQDVTFRFRAQRFVDEDKTPIEDASKEWKEEHSPFVTVAHIHIPSQDLETKEARATEADVETLEFNPWNNITDDNDFLRPLGNMNRARRLVYQASAAARRRR